jgi:hypothetical protein
MGGGGEYEWTESTISVIGSEKSINISAPFIFQLTV